MTMGQGHAAWNIYEEISTIPVSSFSSVTFDAHIEFRLWIKDSI